MLRIGHGFDIHRFIENKPLILGGVHIPSDKGMEAHSDGDVLIHAICDALLGAAALGDIGQHFPDTDKQYAEVDSRILLMHVVKLIHQHHYQINNIDSTIIAQEPKFAPYIEAMRINLANDLQIAKNCVSVKATTMEKLDAIGEKKGIAVHAVVLLSDKN